MVEDAKFIHRLMNLENQIIKLSHSTDLLSSFFLVQQTKTIFEKRQAHVPLSLIPALQQPSFQMIFKSNLSEEAIKLLSQTSTAINAENALLLT